MGDKFEFPKDPEVRATGAIALGALLVLVVIGRVFRDVNPA
jgi:hypothetical protein